MNIGRTTRRLRRRNAFRAVPDVGAHVVRLADRSQPELVVRTAKAEDGERLAAMVGELSDLARYFRFHAVIQRPLPQSMIDELLHPPGAALVAERAGVLVGHAIWAWDDDSAGSTAELAVMVAESERGRGLGTRMLTAVAANASAAGATTMLFFVNPSNEPMIRIIRRIWPAAHATGDGSLLTLVAPVPPNRPTA